MGSSTQVPRAVTLPSRCIRYSQVRKRPSNYYTLPILINPSTNAKLGGSLEIATYLQEAYPAAGAGDLFPSSGTGLHRMETRYEEYCKFNTADDAAFTSPSPSMNYQIQFDTDMTYENKADFIRHASVASSADIEVKVK
ncbi:hypothetical protein N7528_004768 [Penicillium herquei]|nr:hypothetical protein N7528_004768 [Penicillium herquei]